jgi:predicted permease
MAASDLRYGARMLTRQPAFTAVAVMTLALGIGANSAIFTLFDAVLLQPLPIPDPHRLVLFDDSTSEGTRSTTSLQTGRWTLFSFESYEYLRKQPLPFESFGAVRSGYSSISVRIAAAGGTPRQAERASAHLVSGNYFSVMGVGAALGRTLTADDDRPAAPPVAVASYPFWVERLHGDPAAIGTVVVLNNTPFTIVGVAPPEFFGELVRQPPDVWVPLVFQPQMELRPSYLDQPGSYWLRPMGRLARNATRAQAQAATTNALQQFLTNKEGSTITDDVARQIRGVRVELVDGAAGISGLRYRYSQPLHVLLFVVALVLVLACANVGNLLLSRAAARRSEISVRVALGATRGRLVRQMLTESLLLAAMGAACGVLLGQWVVSLLAATIVTRSSPVHPTIDATVLMFTLGITALAAVLFGLAPALAAGRSDVVSALKAGGRGGAGGGLAMTRALVVAQIAISLVLLVGANLFARTLLNLERQSFGFDHSHVLLARVNPRLAGYTPDTIGDLHRRLYERVTGLPGVLSATIARYSPLGGSRSVNSGTVEGYVAKPGESVEFETQVVAPTYPETLGIRLVRGRAIGLQDSKGAPKVAMVNESFVRHFMADRDPVGRHFGFGSSPDIQIVGVLADARFQDDRGEVAPIVFTPLFQEATQFALDAEIEVRTAADPTRAAGELRQAVMDVDANLPMNDPKTLTDQVNANFDSERLGARLVSAFGLLALVLASVGLYGVVTQGVVRRTNEIGVRMALGAQRAEVLWMVLRDTIRLLAIGVVVGAPVAYGAARLVAHQLFGVSPASAAAFGAAIGVLVVVSVTTGLFPARRATRVDPMIALRAE